MIKVILSSGKILRFHQANNVLVDARNKLFMLNTKSGGPTIAFVPFVSGAIVEIPGGGPQRTHNGKDGKDGQ